MVLMTEMNMMRTTPTVARPLQHHEHNSDKKILNEVMIIEIIVPQVAATTNKCMFCGVNQPITNFLGM
jgi:hypothetical protein